MLEARWHNKKAEYDAKAAAEAVDWESLYYDRVSGFVGQWLGGWVSGLVLC